MHVALYVKCLMDTSAHILILIGPILFFRSNLEKGTRGLDEVFAIFK